MHRLQLPPPYWDRFFVQISAILRHPVFVDGRNYSGMPGMATQPFLREQVLLHFAHEAAQLPDALYIPMGGSVAEGLGWLAREGVIRRDRILHGLPHASGANGERVAYFLGRKERAALSSRTNARQIDAARATLLAQMDALSEGACPGQAARQGGTVLHYFMCMSCEDRRA